MNYTDLNPLSLTEEQVYAGYQAFGRWYLGTMTIKELKNRVNAGCTPHVIIVGMDRHKARYLREGILKGEIAEGATRLLRHWPSEIRKSEYAMRSI